MGTRQGEDWQEGVVSVDWVKGHFDHTAECLIAQPVSAPPLPLHPEVLELTEHLLSLGVPTSEILVQNQKMLEKFGNVCATSQFRVFLEHKVCFFFSFLLMKKCYCTMHVRTAYMCAVIHSG